MAAFEIGTFTLGALIGIVIGAFLGHALAIRRGKGLAKHHAAIVFKQIITPALYKLENGDSQIRVIQDTFETHYQAAITFSTYLKGAELESFNTALDHYKQWQSTMCGRDTSEIMYNAEDPKYLNAKVINPIDLLKKLSMHANT
jgi:hypothetical protein